MTFGRWLHPFWCWNDSSSSCPKSLTAKKNRRKCTEGMITNEGSELEEKISPMFILDKINAMEARIENHFSQVHLRLVHTSDGIGVGIGSARSVTVQCKSKSGICSGVGISTESESEGPEEFLILPIPLLLPLLLSYRFTLDQNFLPIPTSLTTPLPSLPSLVWTSLTNGWAKV